MIDLKISISLATFNGARFLREQLASLIEQTFLPTELVVTDDGSTDETLAILEWFAGVAPFPVSVYRNEQRLGYGMNFLKAASLCSGDVIAFSDQDDVWLPAKLERLRKAFGHLQADFVAHAAEVTDARLVRMGKRYPDIDMDRCFAADEVREIFYPGFAIAVSRKFLDGVRDVMSRPGFHVEAHDGLLCGLAAVGCKRCELSDSLVLYRQHEANLIGYHGAVLLQKVA